MRAWHHGFIAARMGRAAQRNGGSGMNATRIGTNRANQTTWAVPTAAFGDDVPARYVRTTANGGRVHVTFGARASAIIAAIPAADRVAAIVGAARAAADDGGRRSNAGTNRVDTHHVMASRGVTGDAATATWRGLANTRARRSRAARVVAPADAG